MSKTDASPVRFKASTLQRWWDLVFGAAFLASGASFLIHGGTWPNLSFIFLGLVSLLQALFSFFRGPRTLELDQSGFTYKNFRRSQRFAWKDVSNFHLKGLSKQFPGMSGGAIHFHVHDTGSPPRDNHSKIVNQFGKPTSEILALLTRHRDQAAASTDIAAPT